jgi:hypothetical protein
MPKKSAKKKSVRSATKRKIKREEPKEFTELEKRDLLTKMARNEELKAYAHLEKSEELKAYAHLEKSEPEELAELERRHLEKMASSEEHAISSSSASVRGKFSIELSIVAHGKLQTEKIEEHSVPQLSEFQSYIDLCIFSTTDIGKRGILNTHTEESYRETLIEELKKIHKPKRVEASTFSVIINQTENNYKRALKEQLGQELEHRNVSRSEKLLPMFLNERPCTYSCGYYHNNKNYKFFDSKITYEGFEFGIFVLKTIQFKNGRVIHENTNLLEMDEFVEFMKYYDKFIEKKYDGYHVTSLVRDPTHFGTHVKAKIQLSEIIYFFESLNEDNEIYKLNIFDRTCNVIEKSNERSNRLMIRNANKVSAKSNSGGNKGQSMSSRFTYKKKRV